MWHRGSTIPALCGAYIYGDWGSGKIWALHYNGQKVTEHKLILDSGPPVSSFGIDEDYEVYVVDYMGTIYKIKAR